MSHIVSFRIEGLAGRKEPLELELNRDANIFFGLNGSGKTSLLKILHSAMCSHTANLPNVPFTSAEVSIYSVKWRKTFTRSLKKPKPSRTTRRLTRRVVHHEVAGQEEVVTVETLPSDDDLVWSCTPSTPRWGAHAHWAHEYLPTTRLHVSDAPFGAYSEASGSGRSLLTEEHLDSFFANSVEHLWSSYSAEVLGAVRTAQEQGLASILRAVLSTESAQRRRRKSKLTPKTAYARVHNFLQRQGSASILGTQTAFTNRYNADPTLQDVVQDIDSVEDKIEEAMSARNMLQELIARMFKGNKEIRYTDESIDVYTQSGDKIGLASLSSGEKHLLRLFVPALLVGQSSMMIDEPELSLHVDWQRALIHSLRALNSTAQLILATHSPEVLADVPDDKIFRI